MSKTEIVSEIEKTLIKEKVEAGEYNLEIVKDFYGNVDPSYLSKTDPNYAYRFIRDEHKNIALKTGNLLFQKGGWQIVPKNHLLKLGIKEKELSVDGLLRRGDLILCFMPKSLYEEKIEYREKQAKEPMKMVNRLLKKGDSSIGGKDMHDTMKGIQTQIDLRM